VGAAVLSSKKGGKMKKAKAVTLWALCFLFAFFGGSEGAAPSKFAGQWVLGSDAVVGKPDSMRLFKNGKGVVNGQTDVSWQIENKRFVVSSPTLALSCKYQLSGYELTLFFDAQNSAVYVKKEKLEKFRAKQFAAAEAERARQAAETAKPYIEQAKQRKSQIERLLSQYFVHVSGGTFLMGCTVEQDTADCDKDEKIVNSVTVGNFQIGKYEVTQNIWELVMGDNPSAYKGDNLPVESVSWEEVQVFISTLNVLTGKKYRLPTEAEWEYAARGGAKSKGYRYSGSNDIEAVAWYGRNSGSKTRQVGSKQANELGIYDMSGNVWEWVRDWYGSYGTGAKTNPTGPRSGHYRVIRGGSWHYNAKLCRVSNRDVITPDYRFSNLGFRLALAP